MEKEALTMRQAICVLIMFFIGSAAIMGMGYEVGQDYWIALLMGAAFASPMLFLYGRLQSLLPNKTFFDLAEAMLGKVFGKVLILLITWYCLHLCALVLRNFSEFVEICVMPETPQLPIMLIMMMVVVYMLKSGVETMGKWSTCMLPVNFLIIILTILISLNKMDFTQIMPFFSHSIGSIAKSSYSFVTFPFLEAIVFLCAVPSISKPNHPYKLYIYPLLMGTLALRLVSLRNIFVLGISLWEEEYFPSYVAVKVIHLSDLVSRVEGSIAMGVILGGIMKLSVCLLAATRGIAHLFGLRDYKQILIPMGLLATALSGILYKSNVEMFEFITYYKFYAIPFQFIIPVILWIVAEYKTRKKGPHKKREAPS